MRILLNQIREQRGLSLKELSDLTGIEEQLLSDIENGYIPRVEVFVDLLDGLHLEFEELVEPK